MSRLLRLLELQNLQRADQAVTRCAGCGAWVLDRPCSTPFCTHPTAADLTARQQAQRRDAIA